MNEKITMIRTEELLPHPNNPRKDVGDITELAESVKKNGIMQNLTVMKQDATWLELAQEYKEHPSETLRITMNAFGNRGGYIVLIGHRRLAAAKAAGLEMLPCRIIQPPTLDEQIAIMLEENMQRNDLTLREQAEGFQMMLDLGESYQTIKEKTGFSETTVRRRVKLLDFDEEILEKKQHQFTIADMDELAKVDDREEKNRILNIANNSAQIKAEVEYYQKRKERQEIIDEMVAVAKKNNLVERPDEGWRQPLNTVVIGKEKIDELDRTLDRLADDALWYDVPGKYDQYFRIYGEMEDTKKDEDPYDIGNRVRTANRAREDMIKGCAKMFQERLKEFVVKRLEADEDGEKEEASEDDLKAIVRKYIDNKASCFDSAWDSILNVEDVIEESESEKLDEYEELDGDDIIQALIGHSLSNKILLMTLGKLDTPRLNWTSDCNEGEREDWANAVAILNLCGFYLSEEEEKLIRGTLPIFREVTEENIEQWEEGEWE